MLLVVCPDQAVAAWSAKLVVITEPGLVLTPVVLGPRHVPVLTDVEVARDHPELAVLSALVHGGGVTTFLDSWNNVSLVLGLPPAFCTQKAT